MKRKVLITVKESYLDDLPIIQDALNKQQVEIEDVQPFGVITGRVDDDRLSDLKAEDYIEGIDFDEEVGMV